MKLSREEWALIESALMYDRVGTWGSGRGEAIQKLLAKLKKEKVSA